MTGIEVAEAVLAEGCQVFRTSKNGGYECRPYYSGSQSGWTIMDSFTASAIVCVHKALNETNRSKFGGLPLMKMAAVAYKLMK